ncbi:vascular endothelial growth factor receptor 1 isoform X3 [Manduca sexta]|uniref:vascular endothelial growth factor receptor 1 isoform X3 n=2 Tax=Manduca sexta TaxID=7130 RepID=UPI00188ECCF3|nr:vascular endothelial growth factor receptor 1 isoform X3 [Manduca sexta]
MPNNYIHWMHIAVTGFVILVSSVKADTDCSDTQTSIGPLISPCRSEFILQKGQNFTIKCKGKTEIQFKQQEPPEEKYGPFNMTQSMVTTSDIDYPFESTLNLFNVDRFAIGYYACHDNTLNISNILNNLIEEPGNNEHAAFFYIYVEGTESIFAPMRELVLARCCSKIVIECRPSTPDVKVELLSSNKMRVSKSFSPKIGFTLIDKQTCSTSAFQCIGHRGNDSEQRKYIRITKTPPDPKIIGGEKRFVKGETFTINCTVEYTTSLSVNLIINHENGNVINEIINTNSYEVTNGILFYNLTVVNATKANAGTYVCVSKNSCGNKTSSFKKVYVDKPYIKLVKGNTDPIILTKQPSLTLQGECNAYPPVKFSFFKNGVEIFEGEKYILDIRSDTHDATLKIKDLNLHDIANYTIKAQNNFNESSNVTFDVRVQTPPTVYFGGIKKVLLNTQVSLDCKVTGYPLPEVTWIFSNGEKEIELPSTNVVSYMYNGTSYLDTTVTASGNLTCKAKNTQGESSKSLSIIVYEIHDGFGITENNDMWFSENDNVAIKCLASIYDFQNVTWLGSDGSIAESIVQYTDTIFSHVAILKIDDIDVYHSGNYTCRGITNKGEEKTQTIQVKVEALRSPTINEPEYDVNEELYPSIPIQFHCQADAVPPPKIEWYKDGDLLVNDTSKVIIYETQLNRTSLNSTIVLGNMKDEKKGKYECVAISNSEEERRSYTLLLKTGEAYATYLSVIAVIFFCLILLVVYLTWKIKKEKQFRKELAAAGLLYFKEGVTKSLNPDLGIDEQAELLPYDEKFEFPSDKLVLGKQLGAGAFGVVYKADARGIINAEETTPVAVKMVKKTADNMYIKALASELKIMVHLGKHVNIVNLLGACTKNVGKRELIVIVEYCKFGNIHNYMQRHREVFIDQLTDNVEKNLGKINRGFTYTGSVGAQSDYFSSANTQETDHTFLNTENTNRSTRKDNPSRPVEMKQVSEGYVQPEWRSNYESDYSYDGRTPRPLTSRDLLAWAFQIARGMEYLASRKVLHGDLAARNVLLADDNIVKICDFGLARSIYKNDEYQKKENSPLPVKWLAIECMTDRIFSTQSDVWSFGIVLWELFSLAKTPYPNISPSNLLQWLSEGNRLEKPPYADDRIYDVMMRCWQQKPTARPSFTELQEILGTFLEDNVRNHYVDLNSAYMDLNARQVGQEDYLAMMCSPDYNNLVTPSPHHYVNMTRSFFPPTPTPLDEEGYLQMSPAKREIFSPRAQGTTFDFDARKFNPRVSEASSGGSELTPMLTLNNLPARSGSESEAEGASPQLGTCPRIDEEVDDVFHTDTNKNHNTAVTNPTYITFDVDAEKKPHDLNSYVNINVAVPNGLVK